LLIGLIIVAWLFSLSSIPKESSPEIDFGIISIATIYPWSTPQDIDNLVTDKIEKEIKNIDGIKTISSTSRVWVSSIVLEFENNTDMTQALFDVKDKVDSLTLPSDAETPIVKDITTNNEMMFSIILYGDENKYIPYYIKEKGRKLKANLEWKWWINRIDFDASFNMSLGSVNGGWDSFYDIQVKLNKQKTEELWLSLSQISQNIRNRNSNQPLWNHTIENLWYDFRIQGEIKTIQDLWDIPIATNNLQNTLSNITLKDIATIQKKLKSDNIQKAWSYNLSWQNYITLFFNKQKWDNIFTASKQAKKALEEEFQKIDYKWLSYTTTLDMAEILNEDYDKLSKNWLQTLILVFIALLIFVWFKESLIATITLPLAFFIAFIVLKNIWLSLNFLTNFSFIITFWIAIDTTIVIIEWAHERIKQWFNPKNAILLAVKEYKTPLISWTATTIFVFIPLLTLPGVMWKFLAYIPITIFATLVAALLISLTVNSALYYKLSKKSKYFNSNIWDIDHMKPEYKILLTQDRKWKLEKPENKKDRREKILEKLSLRYANKLWIIIQSRKKRIISIILPIITLILSFVFLSPIIGLELFPSNDSWFLTINIEWQNGTTKEHMVQYYSDIEKTLSQQPEIKIYYSNIDWNKINTSIELVNITQRDSRSSKSTDELELHIDNQLSHLKSQWLKVSVKAEKDGPPSESAIWIKLITDNNDNIELLKTVSLDFENFLTTIPWTKNVQSSSQKSPWQFVYQFDKTKMALLWLNPYNFVFEIFGVTNGLSAWSIKGTYDDHDIKVFFDENIDNVNPQNIAETNINTPAWKINFGNITNYNFTKAISSISREDNKIMIRVWSDVNPWINATEIQTKLVEFAQKYNYPASIKYSMWGENEENAELIQSILVAFAIALLFIFGILVLQFNSYTQPIIILYSVIIGLLWANIWLRITGQSYWLMFGIWFIALTGIVVNDAIVLLDRINKNINKWMIKLDAIKEAGKSRLQPIILTTLTTFLGLTSILSDAMRKPLAIKSIIKK